MFRSIIKILTTVMLVKACTAIVVFVADKE